MFDKNLIGSRLMARVYAEYWRATESKRMEDAQRLYDWYYNDRDAIISYIKQSLTKTFKTKTINKLNIRVMNIVRRVIDKMATINRAPIKRFLDGGIVYDVKTNKTIQSKDDIVYQSLLMGSTISKREREWRRLGIYFNTVLVQPVWVYDTINPNNPDFKPYLDFIVHTPAHTCVKTHPSNPNIPIEFWYEVKHVVDGIEQNVLVFWSKTEHYMLTADGYKIAVPSLSKSIQENSDFINPYNVLPIAVYRNNNTADFWGEGLWDLVDGNEEICMQLTNLFYTTLFQSHGQLVSINMGVGQELETGPDKIHAVDNAGVQGRQQSQEYYINPNVPIKPIQDLIDWFIDGIQKIKGLAPQSYQVDPKQVTGIAKIMDAAEIAEDRANQMQTDIEFEYDLFEKTKRVWNYWNPTKQISDTAEFSIEYDVPAPSKSIDEKIKEREAGLRNNWLSLIDIIIEDNPTLNQEQAIKKLDGIISQNRKLKDIYGILDEENNTDFSTASAET